MAALPAPHILLRWANLALAAAVVIAAGWHVHRGARVVSTRVEHPLCDHAAVASAAQSARAGNAPAPRAAQTVDFDPANLPLSRCRRRPLAVPTDRFALDATHPRTFRIYEKACQSLNFSRIAQRKGADPLLLIRCPHGQPAFSMLPPDDGAPGGLAPDERAYTGPVGLGDWPADWIYAHCTVVGVGRQTALHVFSNERWLADRDTPAAAATPPCKGAGPGGRVPLKPLVLEQPVVIMLQFDATGHDAFARSHPQLDRLLRDPASFETARAFTMDHLWANGYNSPPNMARLMLDANDGEGLGVTHDLRESLFHTAKCQGMRTAFLETYYPQYPTIFAAKDVDKQVGADLLKPYGNHAFPVWDAGGCVGGVWLQKEFVRLLHKIIQQHEREPSASDADGSKGLFVYFNQCDGHSEDPLQPRIKDAALVELLVELDHSGVLDRTLLLMFSDHGLHFSAEHSRDPGNSERYSDLYLEYEHRNPVLRVLVGNAVAAALGGADKVHGTLAHNQGALIGHSDIYATVSAALGAPGMGRSGAYNILQSKIPMHRTCKDAHIPLLWCNCWVSKTSVPDGYAQV